jgi:hypothetical protein
MMSSPTRNSDRRRMMRFDQVGTGRRPGQAGEVAADRGAEEGPGIEAHAHATGIDGGDVSSYRNSETELFALSE